MELLEKNIRLFEKMKELASQQQSCLEENRLDTYFQLSRQRDQLRTQITLNEKSVGSLATGNGRTINQAVGRHILEMVELIRLIQEIDTGIRQTLLLKKESIASEIRDMRKGRVAVKGYGIKLAKPAKFIDKKS